MSSVAAGVTSSKANCLTFGSRRHPHNTAIREYIPLPRTLGATTTLGSRASRLCAVKEGLYNPALPRLRRMDMDSISGKLPEEHSRLTSGCSAEAFRWINSRDKHSTRRPPLLSVKLHKEPENQREVISTVGEKPEDGFDAQPPVPIDDYHKRRSRDFMNYISPISQASGRYTLRQEPSIGSEGQRIVPATINNRHRDLISSTRYNGISAHAWRP